MGINYFEVYTSKYLFLVATIQMGCVGLLVFIYNYIISLQKEGWTQNEGPQYDVLDTAVESGWVVLYFVCWFVHNVMFFGMPSKKCQHLLPCATSYREIFKCVALRGSARIAKRL